MKNVGRGIETASSRLLDRTKQIKPLDFGKEGICGSLSATGNIILLHGFHSREGFAGLSTSKPFPMEARYDQESVRKYRRDLVDLEGFGPAFKEPPVTIKAHFIYDAIPHIELIFDDGSSAIVTVLVTDDGVVQRWQFSGQPPCWSGSLSLQRAAYTQLTEGGPLADVAMDTQLNFSGGRLTVTDSNLKSALVVDGFSSMAPDQNETSPEPVNVVIPEGNRHTVILTYALGEDRHSAESKSEALAQYQDPDSFDGLLSREAAVWRDYMEGVPDDLLLRRGLVYGRMVSVPTSTEATCIMTDHMLLPLSWNRDAYFVAIALLRWGEPHWDIVRRHLIWMFEEADRGQRNEWGRCYLVNGKIKDHAYQLDQQLFPLLELVDYVVCSGDKATLERLRPNVKPLVDTILSHKSDTAYLFPTDETPGDDPLDYKYHFSSHILAWYTFHRLETLLPGNGYEAIAEKVREATLHYFTAPCGERDIFSYATDLQGNHLFYHDANDVPLALATLWGFVSEDDPVWLATVEFAFTEDNEGGYYGRGRLGSVHTPAPWPLGDVQKLTIARIREQPEVEKQALRDLHSAAQWDGGLPEAYDGETFEVASRNWFAWPNAYYVIAELDENDV